MRGAPLGYQSLYEERRLICVSSKVGTMVLCYFGLVYLLGQGRGDWHPDSSPGNFTAHRLLVLQKTKWIQNLDGW
jgi:hypothetical protein